MDQVNGFLQKYEAAVTTYVFRVPPLETETYMFTWEERVLEDARHSKSVSEGHEGLLEVAQAAVIFRI